ncbi:response regulator [Pseudozobellia thermophila]|uniref:Two component transcriptional regulator, LuxR family n=1 Tax=Pseudozobellia thermophila TaxID=192903 RepID=A0A1M6EM68_9FLAO|nr:response regulator transcription factor [Pseudozobellia thermophila]SHI86607.1 two component transcriptional regulator, LuxR family [Pseudozobellia thermophila]
MPHKIIIVDDHKMFIDGLTSIFEDIPNIDIVLKTDKPKMVLQFLRHTKDIDLIISDISMPEMDGIALSTGIKKEFPQVRMLMVSMHSNANMFHQLKQNGVNGYVQKNASKAELLKAVDTILSGKNYFSDTILKVYKDSFFTEQETKETPLSSRELQVLELIAREYTTKEIADKLYISKHTVETYRKNLLLKLDAKNLAGLTKHAIYLGLIDTDPKSE